MLTFMLVLHPEDANSLRRIADALERRSHAGLTIVEELGYLSPRLEGLRRAVETHTDEMVQAAHMVATSAAVGAVKQEKELGEIRGVLARIASALEGQEPMQVPAAVVWHVGTPQEE